MKFEEATLGCTVRKTMPPKIISSRGLSLIRVRPSLNLPAALMPKMFVTIMISMKMPLIATPYGPVTPGTSDEKY